MKIKPAKFFQYNLYYQVLQPNPAQKKATQLNPGVQSNSPVPFSQTKLCLDQSNSFILPVQVSLRVLTRGNPVVSAVMHDNNGLLIIIIINYYYYGTVKYTD